MSQLIALIVLIALCVGIYSLLTPDAGLSFAKPFGALAVLGIGAYLMFTSLYAPTVAPRFEGVMNSSPPFARTADTAASKEVTAPPVEAGALTKGQKVEAARVFQNAPAIQNPGVARNDANPHLQAQANSSVSANYPVPGCPDEVRSYDIEAADAARFPGLDELSMSCAIQTFKNGKTVEFGCPIATGDNYAARGQFRKAITEYTRVLREWPDLPAALFGRAAACERTGDKECAIRDYCRILVISARREGRKAARERIAQLTGQPATASPSPSGGNPLELPRSVMTPLGPQVAEQAARECSKQADARGLHGIERRNFRAQCKAEFQGSVPSAADVPQLRPVNPPRTGAIERGHRRNTIAPFSIETESGTNYLIKLVRVDKQKDHMLIYVTGGETYSTKIPTGTYNIRAAAGSTWYGHKDFFGPSSHFFRMRNKDGGTPTFNFYRQGNSVYGMKLSLKKVAEGNMEEEQISRDEF